MLDAAATAPVGFQQHPIGHQKNTRAKFMANIHKL